MAQKIIDYIYSLINNKTWEKEIKKKEMFGFFEHIIYLTKMSEEKRNTFKKILKNIMNNYTVNTDN
jgi:hypothetical protein